MSDFSWKDKIEVMKADRIGIFQAAGELAILLDRYGWFYATVIENNNICVYVTEFNKECMAMVPDVLYGFQVTIGFASYLTCAEKYGKKSSSSDILNILEETE